MYVKWKEQHFFAHLSSAGLLTSSSSSSDSDSYSIGFISPCIVPTMGRYKIQWKKVN